MLLFWLERLIAPGWACSFASPGELVVDNTLADDTPPVLEEKDTAIQISRGVGPTCLEGDIQSSTSCDDLGVISLSLAAATDAESPFEADENKVQVGVGYRLRVVSGTLPDGLSLSEVPSRAFFSEGRASISLIWIDGAEDEQEPFSLILGVQAVDLAGNLSEEIEIPIEDPGSREEDGSCWEEAESTSKGCAALAPPRPRALGVGALLLLGLVALRRRRRSP